ncbi:hypothetical protein ACVW1C_005764 [Bradyrhizobium sp. USDA 4011]
MQARTLSQVSQHGTRIARSAKEDDELDAYSRPNFISAPHNGRIGLPAHSDLIRSRAVDKMHRTESLVFSPAMTSSVVALGPDCPVGAMVLLASEAT